VAASVREIRSARPLVDSGAREVDDGIDEEELLLDAERGMSGHGLKSRSGPSDVFTTGRFGDEVSFAGRCALSGPEVSVPALERAETFQLVSRPKLG